MCTANTGLQNKPSQSVKDSKAGLCITFPFLSFSPFQACLGLELLAVLSSPLFLHGRTCAISQGAHRGTLWTLQEKVEPSVFTERTHHELQLHEGRLVWTLCETTQASLLTDLASAPAALLLLSPEPTVLYIQSLC